MPVTASYDFADEKAVVVQVSASKEAMEKLCRHCVELRKKKWNVEKIMDKFPRLQDNKRSKLTPIKNIFTETSTDNESVSRFICPSPKIPKPAFNISCASTVKVTCGLCFIFTYFFSFRISQVIWPGCQKVKRTF